jgi:hypothetical protein
MASESLVAVDSDGFPNIDSYWAHHLPLRDHTNKAASAAATVAKQLQDPATVAAERRPIDTADQEKLQGEARQEVNHYWANYGEEQARRAASLRAQEEAAARAAAKAAAEFKAQQEAAERAAAKAAAKLKAQQEAAARAAAKVAAQAAAVQAARHAALEQAVSLSNPVPLGEGALTNNAGRSPMVPKSREMARSDGSHKRRSASTAEASSIPTQRFTTLAHSHTVSESSMSTQCPTAIFTRDSAVAARSKPVLQRDSKQVAELAGRSPMSQKSRGRVAPLPSDHASASVSIAAAPATAKTTTTSQQTAAAPSGLGRPALSVGVQARTAAADVFAQPSNLNQKRSVSVATQATELPEHAATPTLASRQSEQQPAGPQSSSSSNATSSHSSRGVPVRPSTHAWGRRPMQRSNMSHYCNQRQTAISSDSESDESADDASLEDDSRIFSDSERQGYRGTVRTRAQKPSDSNILKPIQARIGKVCIIYSSLSFVYCVWLAR